MFIYRFSHDLIHISNVINKDWKKKSKPELTFEQKKKEFIDLNQDDESHPVKFWIFKEFKKRKARTRKEKKIEKESSRREISFFYTVIMGFLSFSFI